MKFLTIAAVMSLSLSAFAVKKVEFDENQEKACYAEAKKLGCVKAADAAADMTCTRNNKSKITTKCHQVLGIQ